MQKFLAKFLTPKKQLCKGASIIVHTLPKENRGTLDSVWCKMAFFQEGMAQGKIDAVAFIFLVHFGTDQTFKMRYITSMNSHWFQKYWPSSLNDRKKRPI